MRTISLSAALLAVAAPAALHAQPASVAVAPDDAARRTEAHAIIEVMFPPATREATMQKMMDTLTATMLQTFKLPTVDDPGLKAMFDRFIASARAEAAANARANFPKSLAAMEGAYARAFTLAELKNIHAFALTPAGSHYLQRSLELVSDPEVQAVAKEAVEQGRARSQVKVAQFKAEVLAYLNAHPDVAAKIRQGN
ncbi:MULTISPECIES: hypothetical protein [Sphingomonas]|uniref:hypothetical protein n=1 Tax=Sphingomonas TaxID=13687 RepID=UPI000DEF8554|nr:MULTISPECIES: hypothetical protein [Sphingomonas]